MKQMSIKQYKGIQTEEQDQVALAEILDRLGLLWTHPPNGGKRHIGTAVKMKRAGVKSGVPDVLIFDPPPNYPDYFGAAIELKRACGGTVSESQAYWINELSKRKWKICIAEGLNEAYNVLYDWGYLK